MAISASQIATTNTLEQFRTEFNILRDDVSGLEDGTVTFSEINATTLGSAVISVKEDGTIVFEGATSNAFETTLTVADPTADRTITLPDVSGTVVVSGDGTFTVSDGGTIGSTSDPDALSISSGGVVAVSATTSNTSASNGALTVAGGVGIAADLSVGDDIRLISDSAVLSFGADSDTTLTHSEILGGSGLTLNSTNKILFNAPSGENIVLDTGADAGDSLLLEDGDGLDLELGLTTQFIHAPSTTVLNLAATDKLALTSTLIDVVGNLAISGNLALAGNLEVQGTSSTTVTASGAIVPDANDGATIGTAALAFADLFLADGAVINLGDDEEVTLTHVPDTGLILNGANVFQFRDSGLTIGSNADGDLDIVSDGTAVDSINIESAGGITLDAGTAGSGIIYEDDGTEMLRIHNSSSDVIIESKVSDKDIIIKGNDGGSSRTVATFDMSAGGDLFLTGGLIDLKNNGSNVSQIKFYCESSNAHAQTLIGAPHAESGSNTLTLPSSGGNSKLLSATSTATVTNKTLTSPVINTGTFGTSILPVSADGTTLGSASKEFSDLFLADSGTIQFGNDQDVTLTHVADTGLLLNTTMVVQFRDSAINIGSPADGDLDINADDEIELNSTLIDINGNVEISGTTTQTGVATFTAIPVASAGLSVKNGATSAGFLQFFEDSNNGSNKVTLIGPASTADITLTLPAAAGTLATTASAADEATALAIALG